MIERDLGHRVPDYIHLGFLRIDSLLSPDAVKYIGRHGIRVITEVGDISGLLPVIHRFDGGCHADIIILRAQSRHNIPDNVIPFLERKSYYDGASRKYKPSPLYDAKLVFIPWCGDPGVYAGAYANTARDIELAFIATVTSNFKYHDTRRGFIRSIQAMRGHRTVIASKVYGQEYIDILGHSKMLVVDDSERGILTQKYIEAALSGTVMIGTVPCYAADILQDNVHMLEATPATLAVTMDRLLSDTGLMARLRKSAYDLIKNEYNIIRATNIYETTIMEEYYARHRNSSGR